MQADFLKSVQRPVEPVDKANASFDPLRSIKMNSPVEW